ncbi:MAG: glycosyl hydrolase family 25 [Prevotella sp.]|nr:glycosyl hydrolase family 25 [Prevotella sp.]
MKHLLFTTIILLAAACSGEEPAAQQTATTDEQQTDAERGRDERPGKVPEGWSRIWAEVSYYLERHSPEDEGYDLVSRYAEHGDSALVSYVPRQPLQLFGIGRWRGLPRWGTCLTRDAIGRVVVGLFEADTLVSGIRIDSAGVYGGALTRNAEAGGYGVYQYSDGSYYEGDWLMDMRNGYGLGIAPTFLHAGQWRNDQFKGQRMRYTGDRIYGIDISRYQHERGKKRYGIDWKRLRITGLGHRISQQRVSGEVDYPVSFAYIKSTEGISIKNNYFMADYSSARSHGIAVGAYHFFSTRQGALAQASYFLQNSCFRRGDLPPMLDLEPSDAQIKAMGGPEAMFREVRLWLQRVEARLGVRPIIYVNQRFVRLYLKEAPDLKQDYQVWIARYGEYKPDVHLAFWQLSADGRVRGIQGEVDLNVFNGYQSQWEEFLRQETFR